MKILAVRLREVGPFLQGAALEGLSGALDVLSGPNELGKSTLFRALQTLFFESHATTQKEVERLRPYSGGAPMIEADFETSAGRWRIRKQFLSGKAAVLTDLASNRIAARGKDADARLGELIGVGEGKRGDFGRFSLLWVAQTAALDDLAAEGQAAAALHSVIEREVEAVAGGVSARAVRERVRAELAELVTEKTERPRGAYAAALNEADKLANELHAAREAEQRAADRALRLDELRQRLTRLTDPAAIAQLAGRLAAATAARASAREATQALQLASARLKAAEQEAGEARRALASFDAAIGEETRLRTAADVDAKQLAEAAAAAKSARRLLDALMGRVAAQRRAELVARFKSQQQRILEASRIEIEIRELERQVHINGATPALLAKLEAEDRAILALESRLSASAPSMLFDLEPGGQGKVRSGGKLIAAKAVIKESRPVVIEIDGIGRITVTPGGSGLDEDAQADLAAHREELAHVLATLGAADIAAARSRAEQRRTLENELRSQQARFQALAPGGVSRLKLEAEQFQVQVSAQLDSGQSQPGDLAEQAEPVDEAGLRAAQARAEDLEREATRLTAVIEERRRQLDVLAARLPSLAERATRRNELQQRLSACEAAANEASRTRSAWAEKAPADADLARLEADVARAAGDETAAVRQRHQIELDIRGEQAALDQDGETGTSLRRSELEGELARAQTRVKSLKENVEVLTLLRETLDAAALSVRETFLQPVESRLAPFLDLVFPGSRLDLGQGFGITGIARTAAKEPIGSLSVGTREQLAVLVRLGFGKLFAESGHPAPVVLDDALVYSDDVRIARLFEALRLAAQSHQVIVLTCRSATFANLGGRRLEFVPWDPQATAA